jgi:hypothetical protein
MIYRGIFPGRVFFQAKIFGGLMRGYYLLKERIRYFSPDDWTGYFSMETRIIFSSIKDWIGNFPMETRTIFSSINGWNVHFPMDSRTGYFPTRDQYLSFFIRYYDPLPTPLTRNFYSQYLYFYKIDQVGDQFSYFSKTFALQHFGLIKQQLSYG